MKIALSAGIIFLITMFIPYPATFTEYMNDYAHHATDLRILGAGFFLLRSAMMLPFIVILTLMGFWLPEEKEYMRKLLRVANGRLPSRLQLNGLS